MNKSAFSGWTGRQQFAIPSGVIVMGTGASHDANGADVPSKTHDDDTGNNADTVVDRRTNAKEEEKGEEPKTEDATKQTLAVADNEKFEDAMDEDNNATTISPIPVNDVEATTMTTTATPTRKTANNVASLESDERQDSKDKKTTLENEESNQCDGSQQNSSSASTESESFDEGGRVQNKRMKHSEDGNEIPEHVKFSVSLAASQPLASTPKNGRHNENTAIVEQNDTHQGNEKDAVDSEIHSLNSNQQQDVKPEKFKGYPSAPADLKTIYSKLSELQIENTADQATTESQHPQNGSPATLAIAAPVLKPEADVASMSPALHVPASPSRSPAAMSAKHSSPASVLNTASTEVGGASQAPSVSEPEASRTAGDVVHKQTIGNSKQLSDDGGKGGEVGSPVATVERSASAGTRKMTTDKQQDTSHDSSDQTDFQSEPEKKPLENIGNKSQDSIEDTGEVIEKEEAAAQTTSKAQPTSCAADVDEAKSTKTAPATTQDPGTYVAKQQILPECVDDTKVCQPNGSDAAKKGQPSPDMEKKVVGNAEEKPDLKDSKELTKLTDNYAQDMALDEDRESHKHQTEEANSRDVGGHQIVGDASSKGAILEGMQLPSSNGEDTGVMKASKSFPSPTGNSKEDVPDSARGVSEPSGEVDHKDSSIDLKRTSREAGDSEDVATPSLSCDVHQVEAVDRLAPHLDNCNVLQTNQSIGTAEKVQLRVNLEDRDPPRTQECDHAAMDGEQSVSANRSEPSDNGNNNESGSMLQGAEECKATEPLRMKPKTLMDIARQTEQKNRHSHKHMLLRLFTRSDQHVIETAACKAAGQIHLRDSSSQNITDPSLNSKSSNVNVLLPAVFSDFRKRAQMTRARFLDVRRKGYASTPLSELQGWAKANFFSQTGQKSDGPTAKNKSTAKMKKTKAFSLEYNEASVIAISGWASQSKPEEITILDLTNSDQKKRSQNDVERATVAANFRKCSICGYFGHYEIECRKAGKLVNETAALASEVRVCVNVQELNAAKSGSSGSGASVVNMNEESKSMWKSLNCEVCHCALNPAQMLVCDGCERLYHAFCASPPLKKIPNGEWFCADCAQQESDTGSDVEVEGCGEFLIEQRKKQRQYYNVDCSAELSPFVDWQVSISAVSKCYSDSTPHAPGKRRKRRRTQHDDVDGINIIATSISSTGEKLPNMRSTTGSEKYAAPDDDDDEDDGVNETLFGDMVPGAVVAWFPEIDSSAKDASMHLGGVLAVDAPSNRVLVRAIQSNCNAVLDDENGAGGDAEYAVIQNVSACSTVWRDVDNLHIVAKAPSQGSVINFREDVLPARIAKKPRPSTLNYAAALKR